MNQHSTLLSELRAKAKTRHGLGVAMCVFLLALCSCAGRSTTAEPGGTGGAIDAKAGCSRDDQCPQGFCDTTGQCGEPTFAHGYGIECQIPPSSLPAETRAKLNPCGPYPCKSGRCRSCVNDQECLGDLAVGDPLTEGITCAPVGFVPSQPGRTCGRYGP